MEFSREGNAALESKMATLREVFGAAGCKSSIVVVFPRQ
jgi:hypothetical protein